MYGASLHMHSFDFIYLWTIFVVRLLKNTAILFSVFAVSSAFAQVHAAGTESLIKAVMLRKFVEFVEWPEANAPRKLLRANVCVYGDSDIMDTAVVFSKTSEKSTLKYGMEHIDTLNFPASKCQIVFIGNVSESAMGDAIEKLKTRSVLTISDSSEFVEKGGMVGFVVVDGRLRYNINNSAFNEAGLKVDAQLLEIANKVVN